MNEKDNFALVPRPPGALEKAEPGAKRILSGMVADTLALRNAAVTAEEWCRRGEAYYYGIGVKCDSAEAVKWFRMAANEGHTRGQCWLGYHCQHAWGSEEDAEGGVQWFQKAARKGEVVAAYNLGTCYEGGLGVPIDTDEMIRWYREAAGRGHLEAMFRLGIHYATGPNLDQSGADAESGEGLKLLKRAAEQGHAKSQVHLGSLLGSRYKDYAEQIRWYRMAATQGSPEGQASLGGCYEHGEGVLQDYAEAVRLFRMAAKQGGMHGQYSLGSCYEDGRGVPCDQVEATKWYHLAAENGLMEALRTLADRYESGQGVHRNAEEAWRWYEEAAEQGDAGAQRRLAAYNIMCAKTGDNRWANWRLADAFKWLRLAVEDSGDKLAETELNTLRSSMEPGQIAKAEEHARFYLDLMMKRKKWNLLKCQERPFVPKNRSDKPSRTDSLRIVVFDDEAGPRTSLRVIFKGDFPNAEILTFADAEAALEELEREDPDLFTTDNRHMKISGVEMLRMLAAKQVKYPIFMMTAFETIELKSQLEELVSQGLNVGYLAKPFSIEDIRRLVSTHLGPNFRRI
jgi:TPR repeat protein/ActR/RegA family two-component response regulator